MKRTVTITITVDATEYNDAIDTPEGVVDLVVDMLNNEADLPQTATITCEHVFHHLGDML